MGGEDLDALQRQYGSDEECIKAVIEKFLLGRVGYYYIPTWRALIWALYNANEIEIASSIKSYAEPLQGTTFMNVFTSIRLNSGSNFYIKCFSTYQKVVLHEHYPMVLVMHAIIHLTVNCEALTFLYINLKSKL